MNQAQLVLPNVSVRMNAVLRRSGRTCSISLGDLKWRTSREAGETAWRCGEGRLASVELWRRRTSPGQVELLAGVAGHRGWNLSQWKCEVRIRSHQSERFTWPFAGGAVVPVERLLESRRTLELTYPVYASMQWVDLFGPRGGTYAAAHDPDPYLKHLRVHAERRAGRCEVVFEFIYTDLEWPADRQWLMPPLALARHEGDWRQGARIYRAWADTWFRHQPVPELMKRACGHNMISFPSGGGRVPFKRLPGLAAETRRLGLNAVHIADWMEEGFDTFYPAYQPDPALGGEKGLRRAIRKMAAAGTWTCLYLNGRLLDPAGPHGAHAFGWAVKLPAHVKRRFDEMWERTQDSSAAGWKPQQAIPRQPAPFNRDGTAAQEWWGRVLAPMCPSVPGWQQLWLARMSEVMNRLRPRMLQVDQVCGCWGLPCYDRHHPHQTPALAWSDYKAFTRAMRQRAQAVDPDVALWSEGVNDILGQHFDGLQLNLAFDSLLTGLGEWDPRIFKLTFPEYILVSGGLPREDPRHLAWTTLVGAHQHFYIPDPTRIDRQLRTWLRFIIRVRSRYWREFTSPDVFIPEIAGDAGVRVLGYRHGRRLLLAGGPLGLDGPPDRSFEAEIRLPGPARILRNEWLSSAAPKRVRITARRCRVKGAGPFVLLLESAET